MIYIYDTWIFTFFSLLLLTTSHRTTSEVVITGPRSCGSVTRLTSVCLSNVWETRGCVIPYTSTLLIFIVKKNHSWYTVVIKSVTSNLLTFFCLFQDKSLTNIGFASSQSLFYFCMSSTSILDSPLSVSSPGSHCCKLLPTHHLTHSFQRLSK